MNEWIWWIPLIIIVGIFYFRNKKRKEPISSPPASQTDELGSVYSNIIADYGTVLESVSNFKQFISDEKQLPHPKYRIKTAILYKLHNDNLDDNLKYHLIAGYLALASFQKGVPPEIHYFFSHQPNIVPGTLDRILELASNPKIETAIQDHSDELNQLKRELEEMGIIDKKEN